MAFEQHDVLFLVGPAGSAKTHLAVAFACSEVLTKKKKKIILSRPIVEAGEKLGFLPGTFEEKINPYLMPIFDCLDTIVGRDTMERNKVNQCLEIVPIAYMRGRAEPLNNLISTLSGVRKMGDLNVGDYVFGSNGQPTKITGVYPQGVKKICKVTFSDKSSVNCCEDHLWSTRTLSEKRHNKDFSVKETKEIFKCVKNKWGHKNHEIPIVSSPVSFDSKEVPINPYLLGVLLGDGCFSTNASVTITNVSEDLLSEVRQTLPENMTLSPNKEISYRLSYNINNGLGNPVKKGLRQLNLFGLKSSCKFVPEIYKFNKTDIRLETLRGLMDTDGWVSNGSKKSRIQYYSTSKDLALDVVFLIQSLGGVAHFKKRAFLENDNHYYKNKLIKHIHSLYVVEVVMPPNINPFKCKTKANLYLKQARAKRLISKIEYISQQECQCISVDSDDKLYLTESFIVTHNTFHDSVVILDEAQNSTEEQLKLAMTRLGLNSKMVITGDPTQSDLKGDVALPRVVASMKTVAGIGIVEFNESHIVRHPLVADILAAWPSK